MAADDARPLVLVPGSCHASAEQQVDLQGCGMSAGCALVELVLVDLVANLGDVAGERGLLATHRRGTAAAVLGGDALAYRRSSDASGLRGYVVVASADPVLHGEGA